MFYPTVICAILVLIYMHFVRSFLVLKIGRSYRSRGGQTVKIIAKIALGSTPAFIDEQNRRYYSNGERVDDTGIWNEGRLFEIVKPNKRMKHVEV